MSSDSTEWELFLTDFGAHTSDLDIDEIRRLNPA
jgi:hypothetical protein